MSNEIRSKETFSLFTVITDRDLFFTVITDRDLFFIVLTNHDLFFIVPNSVI